MRRINTWGALAGAAALAVVPLSPAAGASDAATPTLQGTIYEGTAPDCTQTQDVSGRYSIALKDDGSASVSFTMHMDGKIHAAWGGNAFGERWTWEPTDTGYVLSLFDLSMTIDGDTMTFVIPDRYSTDRGDPASCDGYVLATVR